MGEAEAGVLNEAWLFIKNVTRLEHPEATAQARKWLMKSDKKHKESVKIQTWHSKEYRQEVILDGQEHHLCSKSSCEYSPWFYWAGHTALKTPIQKVFGQLLGLNSFLAVSMVPVHTTLGQLV